MQQTIYQEKIFSTWITAIMALLTATFLFFLLHQIFAQPIGARPAPNWFFLVMFLLFLAVTLNFSVLKITMTTGGLTVNYGIFKHKIRWENIADCYLDESSPLRYGGWGVRIAWVNGKWRLVYNVIGGPRIVLSLKKGAFKEFVFSTKNPEEVMKTIRTRIATPK